MEWSLLSRDIEDEVIPVCAELGVGVVAYSPLARNILAAPPEVPPTDWRATNPRYSPENLAKNRELHAKIVAMAEAKQKSAAQLSLAWLYAKASKLGVTLCAIPGTTKLPHALDNLGAMDVALTDAEIGELEALGTQVAGLRGNEQYMANSFHAKK